MAENPATFTVGDTTIAPPTVEGRTSEAVPFSVDIEETPPQLSPDTIDNRTFKINYGLSDIVGKDRDEIKNELAKGGEIDLRKKAAAEVSERKRSEAQRVVIETPAPQLADFVNPVDFAFNTRADTVIETAYGKQSVAILDRTAMQNPDNVLTDARAENPEAVADIFNKRSVLVAKREILNTHLENLNDEIKSQSWGGWLWDQAKYMLPGYSDVQLRGNVRDVGVFSGIGLGENLERQSQALHDMSIDDFKDYIDGIVNNLKTGIAGGNPTLAKEFLEAMLKMSTSDIVLKNFQLPVETIGTGIGTALGKAGAKAIKGTVKSSLIRDVEKAADDIAKETGNPGVSKSTLEAAAGDLESSAVTRSVANVTATADNVPQATRRAIEELSGTLRIDEQNIAANPGRFGQDLVNRITESANNIRTNLITTLKNIQKVERLPDIMANETAVRAIMEGIKDNYRGLRNSVLDISKPYKEDISNTYHVDMYLGNVDGTYFKNRQVAENFMSFHGLKDADILEGKNTKYTPKEVAIKKIEKDIEGAERIIAREEKKILSDYSEGGQSAKSQEQIDIAREYILDRRNELNDLRQTATVEQQGLGYYIKVTKPINETDDVIRNYLAKTTNTKMPETTVTKFVNTMIGKYRTPEDVLSLAERQNRLTATYAPSEYFRIMQENAKEINKLATNRRFGKKRKIWDEWQRGLENAQEIVDPLDSTRKGYFFKDPAEMEAYWMQWFKRLPEEQEIAAYFEFKRGMEIDRIFRNIAEVRNQQRVGAETHNVVISDPAGKLVRSNEFSGVVRKKLPGADDNIAVIDSKGKVRQIDLKHHAVKEKEEWQKLIDSGKKTLIEIYNPELRPLSGFADIGNSRIRYVLADTVETRALDWNQIPRRGGGHIEYDHAWYIKQAKVTYDDVGSRYWYEGDTTIMAVQLERMGQNVADHLENIRAMLKEKNEVGAREYSNKNLHIDWATVHKWFTGSTENGVFIPPRLSVNEPIMVVPRGKAIVDIDKSLENRYVGFKNGMKEGSLARQSRVEYAQERDAFDVLQIDDVGTRNNPLYKVGQADKVDPITTMNRGLSRIAKSNFMDDYKTMAVEHWLQQARPYLQATDSEIKHAPFYYYNEMKWKTGAPKDIVSRLEANKYHIDQMVGQPSLLDGVLHSTAQKMSDAIYGKIGPKALVLEPDHILPYLKDPFKTLRSIAFHTKLGLFNIPQFIVQMGNYSNIFGIAGSRYAAPGSLAAQMHFWSRVNSHPNFINHLDDLASKFHIPGTSRWKPGEFKEAFEEFRKTGFGNVGGEFSMLDNPTSQKLVEDTFGTFLNWGTSPFRAGERNARYGAWYTAFKEFRDKNPVGRITEADRAKILQRADLLNANMSHASSSAIHKGFMSVPTQFYTYQIRLLELFLGNRLTPKEKARMFATNAALYGIPMAGGLTGLPVADYLRKLAMDEGYVVGDNFFQSLFMEGLPASLGAVITGDGDPRAGTYYDVGTRFGTKGLEFLGNAVSRRADRGWLDDFGGPAYSVIKGTINLSDGFRTAILAMMKGETDTFPFVAEDALDVFREISMVNTVNRTYLAATFGRWMSKNDAYLADTSMGKAIFGAVTGLKDQGITDIQVKLGSLQDQENAEKEAEKFFQQEFRRGLLVQTDDPSQAQRFFTRAMHALHGSAIREDRIPSIIERALKSNESILDKVDFDYYIRKAPDKQSAARLEAMRRIQELKDKRNQ